MTAVLCGLCLASSGYAAIDIEEWSEASSGFTIHEDRYIEITAAGTYYFQSYDGANPADIENIWVNPSVSGTVTIYIAQDPNDWVDEVEGPGAANLWEMNIDYDTGPTDDINGVIGSLWLQHSVGKVGSGEQRVIADSSTGLITIRTVTLSDVLEIGTLSELIVRGHPMQGDILIRDDFAGTLTVSSIMYGDIQIGERDPEGTIITTSHLIGTGTITCSSQLLGTIDITGGIMTDDGTSGRITVGSYLNNGHILVNGAVQQTDATLPAIHVQSDVRGNPGGDEEPPAIKVGGELGGVIAVDGDLDNTINGPEITVGSIDTENLGAITIDYNGYQATDTWHVDARILVGNIEYSGNDAAARVYRTTDCKGDLDNDGGQDSDDATAILLTVGDFATDYPGLLGSRIWHGNVDCVDEITQIDEGALAFFVDISPCCFDNCDNYSVRRADLNGDGRVDLGDLAFLLSAYDTVDTDPLYDPYPDFDNDGDVDLSDLAFLLAEYGELWSCPESRGMFGGGSRGATGVTVSVAAYDTSGYSGGGFEGEVDHFVFDLKIEILDPNDDDWTATGAVDSARNDATFLLSSSPTTPDAYATFVAAPWTTLPGSATASVAGDYDPPDTTYTFTTTTVNIGWFDTVESHDGPATVMRLVIDVSEVSGADVSGGFGSVYFSTAGPKAQADILVAELDSGTGSAVGGSSLVALSGEFYVNGQ